jgi:hypothetical protein
MRRGRTHQPKLPLERQVGVALTDEEVAERSRKHCGILSAIEGLKTEIRDVSKDRKDRIKRLEAESKALRQQILDGFEQRSQTQMRYGEAELAQKTLHDVAAKVDPALAGAPIPTEPHALVRSKGKPGECEICGGDVLDPIHKDDGAAPFVPSEPPIDATDGNRKRRAPVDLADRKRARVLNRKARQAEKGGRA